MIVDIIMIIIGTMALCDKISLFTIGIWTIVIGLISFLVQIVTLILKMNGID